MRSGSIAFLSTTLPSYTSPVNLKTLRSSAVVVATPLGHRLSLLRNFRVPQTDRKVNKISPGHNLFSVTTTRTLSRVSASSMASSFSPEKARVPPAIDTPIPPISKVSYFKTSVHA